MSFLRFSLPSDIGGRCLRCRSGLLGNTWTRDGMSWTRRFTAMSPAFDDGIRPAREEGGFCVIVDSGQARESTEHPKKAVFEGDYHSGRPATHLTNTVYTD